MKSLRHRPLFVLALLTLLILPVTRAHAEIRIISVPGFPFFLVMDLDHRNQVRELVLRTPGKTKTLESFHGLTYVEETPLLTYTDRDWRRDLLWHVRFTEEARRGEATRGKDLWIAALTGVERIWIGSAETCPSLWDEALSYVKAPEGTAYLVSPRLPAISPDSPPCPDDELAFVYTIRLTLEGPRFVIVPTVYRQLLRITDRIRSAEKDPTLRTFYDEVFEDFKSMSEGHLPSVTALASFPWKTMDTGNMRP